MSTKLEGLLASGELQRAAAGCPSERELARRLGMTPSAYKCGKQRIVAQGRYWPAFEELQRPTLGVDMAAATERVRAKQEEWRGLPNAGIPDPTLGFEDEPTEERPSRAHEMSRGQDIGKPDKWPSLAAFDQEDPPLPAIGKGFRVSKVSTLVDGVTGETKQQWIKTTAEDNARADWLEAIRSLIGDAPKYEPTILPEYNNNDLLSVFPVGDPHIGQMSWHEDAGANFDLKIAERNLVGAFRHLIGLSPASGRALLIFIGDNTHSDGQSNTTTKGTRVDVDGRTIKMMRVAVSVARQAIDLALAKHGHVTMIVERGNHDELLSAMLALALSLLYENEPRVTIDVSPEMFHWYRFGTVLIGSHHGHKAKPMDLLGVMAVDRVRDWGETKHRVFYVGHEHHEKTKEVPGLIVHNLPTLAAADAWHHAMGYRSQRAMYMDVFHIEHGHVNRHIVGIEQVVRGAA